jgi:hypothetical protein
MGRAIPLPPLQGHEACNRVSFTFYTIPIAVHIVRRLEDNIKMDLQEVGGGDGNWLELVQDRDRWRALVSTLKNFGSRKMRGIS